LRGAAQLHRQLQVPWTIFVTGKTLQARTADILAVANDPLVEIAQHTYNHTLLKSIFMDPRDGRPCPHGGGCTYFRPGGSLEQIRQEVATTQHLIEQLLARRCMGLTGPWGYYRGLLDRPDILDILYQCGIRYLRTYARDHRDCQPTPFDVQPFFYHQQGFPDMLELGVQGYQDDFYWDRFDDRRHGPDYLHYLLAMVDQVVTADLVWSVCAHDHHTETLEAFEQTKGAWLRPLLQAALEGGVRFMTCGDFYRSRSATVCSAAT
jgi:peptidoglycan/xylan/chitin deacetylase (PgdA/CDA1 family)